MQLIVPILLHLSNGSFLTVFSRAFVELCQRDFEAFDDFPGEKGWDREDCRFSRVSSQSRDPVGDRKVATRIEEVREPGLALFSLRSFATSRIVRAQARTSGSERLSDSRLEATNVDGQEKNKSFARRRFQLTGTDRLHGVTNC